MNNNIKLTLFSLVTLIFIFGISKQTNVFGILDLIAVTIFYAGIMMVIYFYEKDK